MLRTLRIWLSAALWSAALAASLGLLEALQQWVRLGLPDDWGFAPGPLRLLLPPMAVYGWFGLGAGLLLAPLAAVIGRLWRRPALFAWRVAVAGAVAALGAVYAGYLLEGRLLVERAGGAGGWAGPFLLLAWAAGLAVLWRPAGRLGRLLLDRSPAFLLAPGLLLLVVTGVWPDWRLEEARLRTSGLALERTPLPGAPPVILITIDAWRADRLSRLDPASPPTPALDRLAAESIHYRRAFAPSPWTLPSMASIMTGLPPRVLGIEPHLPLPAGVPTLAELAWRHGYRTAAFATNAYLAEWYGFARGFDFFEHAGELESLLPARRSILAREAARHAREDFDPDAGGFVVPKVPLGLAWLRRQSGRLGATAEPRPASAAAPAAAASSPPLFLWVHLLDPHLPYTWRELPADAVPAGAAGTAPRREAVPRDGFFARGELTLPALHGIRDGTWSPSAAERAGVLALYDREIQYVDHWFGRLRQHLERLGLWDEAIVLVLADHGEEMFEHGSFDHGHTVLPEVVRVPLLLRLPGGRQGGTVVDDPVCTAEVVPTLCSLLGWALPPGVDGRPFWPPAAAASSGEAGGADPFAATSAGSGRPVLLIENLLYGEPQQGVLAWPLYAVRPPRGAAPVWYDLATDPLAQRPLPPPAEAGRVLAAADSLAAAWDDRAVRRPGAGAAPAVLPDDLRQQMRALGYVR